MTLANTKDNNARVQALKKVSNVVGEINWQGNTVHDSLDKCLAALNLDSNNSGWYTPNAVRINGLSGYYMVNQDGSIFCEARVIKEDEKKFRIEYLSNRAWNEFEALYIQFINEEPNRPA